MEKILNLFITLKDLTGGNLKNLNCNKFTVSVIYIPIATVNAYQIVYVPIANFINLFSTDRIFKFLQWLLFVSYYIIYYI